MAGLAFTGATAQLLSLFTALGSIAVQVFFFLPALYSSLYLYKPGQVVKSVKSFVLALHPAAALLLSGSLFMVLVMGVYPISHPDTIAYHFQVIRWIETYPAVPGLANVNYLYGFQNSWFIVCGLFSFSFAGSNAITFVNTAVLAWLLIFLVKQINTALKKPGKAVDALLWLSLLMYQAWSYTQIRLTATSASPDFIAVLYVLLAVYLYLELNSKQKENTAVIFLVCLFAVTLKLSVLPVIFLAMSRLYPFRRMNIVSFLLLFSFVMIPYIARNIITSGHLFFPVAFPDIVNADWKYHTDRLDSINKYILAYARTRDNATEPASLLAMPLNTWLPLWWQKLYLSDKVIIIAQFLSLLLLIRYKAIIAENRAKKICIFTVIAALVFWFLKAPDPRFGMGFLILLPALVLTGMDYAKLKIVPAAVTKKWMIFVCVLVGIAVSSYDYYRVKNYFSLTGLLYPAGFVIPYNSIYYNEINTSIPLIKKTNKNIVIIPAPDSLLRPFNFRGNSAAEGFRSK